MPALCTHKYMSINTNPYTYQFDTLRCAFPQQELLLKALTDPSGGQNGLQRHVHIHTHTHMHPYAHSQIFTRIDSRSNLCKYTFTYLHITIDIKKQLVKTREYIGEYLRAPAIHAESVQIM